MRFRVVSFVCVQNVAVPWSLLLTGSFFFVGPQSTAAKLKKRRGAHERAVQPCYMCMLACKSSSVVRSSHMNSDCPCKQRCRVRVCLFATSSKAILVG